MKLCNKCGEEKLLGCFRRHGGYVRGECIECEAKIRKAHYAKNPEKYAAASRQWCKDNPGKHAASKRAWVSKNKDKHDSYRRKVIYGIDHAAFTQMLIKQNGVCAICGGGPVGKRKNLSVDHCHKTGKVRALLCSNCNTGLGSFKDNPQLLLISHAYLLQHS